VKTVVVGIGNEFRGDDGAGLAAARALMQYTLPNVKIVELDGEVTRLLDSLQHFDTAIVIDAVQSQALPGTIHRFDASQNPLPGSHTQRSTHGISLGSILELARAQGAFPRKVLVYGIEGFSFEHGRTLTAQVKKAVGRLVSELAEDLRDSRPVPSKRGK
jgi:hydrogenase maturation protease